MNQNIDADDTERGEPKLREYLATARRRRKPLIWVLVAGVLITVSLALFLPASYRSTGTILIEQQELPADLVRSTVTSYADQRVQVISQRVMTTQNLLGIIRRYDLYKREQARESREQLIERMRDDIQFKMVQADVVDQRSGAPHKATIAFTVSYTSPVPDTAAKIANELTTLYLNENLTERNRLAQDAYGFLQTEGDRLDTQIQELETKLVGFKEKHFAELPDLQQVNMQQLDRTEQSLHESQTRRTTLEQQRLFLEAQLAQMKPDSALFSDSGERIQSPSDRLKSLRAKLASATALYAPDHPDVVRMKQEIAGLEAQVGSKGAAAPIDNDLRRTLEQARGELADAQKKYSPDHPDVQRLQRQVTQLEATLAKPPAPPVVGANGASAGGTGTGGPGTGGLAAGADAGPATAVAMAAVAPGSLAAGSAPDNPAYIQVTAQIEAIRSDLQAEATQITRLQARSSEYQRKISVSPQIEKEYRDLTRDYESAQLKYREIRAKQMEAQVAQNLESDRKGERFTLIEPPLPPEDPVSPNRPLVLTLGMLLSLGLAVGTAMFMEAADGTVRNPKDMLEAFSAPMLAVVPKIVTAADIALGRRRVRYTVATVAVAGLAAILAVHFFYRPLDVLWFAAMRRAGY